MAITRLIPQLRTTDLAASLAFYVDKLGFTLEFQYSDFYAGIDVAGQQVHLKLVDEKDPSIGFVALGDHLHLYLEVDDAAAEAERLAKKGIIFTRGLTETPWQTREFYIEDNEGHILCFSQSLPA